MKKLIKILLLAMLSIVLAFSLIACDEAESEAEVTKLTIELFDAADEEAPVNSQALNEEETEYYALTGYSFSDADAKIVSRAAADPEYYGEYYDGVRKDEQSYKDEKARLEELRSLTLPTAVKVAVTESKLTITAEQLASAQNGVVDLSGGDENAVTVNIRALAESALLNHTEIQTLVIPEGYLYIGQGALGGCSSLEELTIPFVGAEEEALNAKKVFGYVFGTVSYTGGVEAIQNYNSTGTATYYIPADLTKVTVTGTLNPYSFYNVTTVKEVTYEVQPVIPAYAFYGCTSLKTVAIDASVTEIGEGAFGGCTALLSVDMPAGLLKIGKGAFENCSKLFYATKALEIPAGVTFIGEAAFSGCSAIETLNAPCGNVVIKANAFANMPALKTATVTNATMSVGVFCGWSEMLKVTYSGSTCITGTIDHAFIGAFREGNPYNKDANIQFFA